MENDFLKYVGTLHYTEQKKDCVNKYDVHSIHILSL